MPCANALARAKQPVPECIRRRNPEPILNHPEPQESVILSVLYHPGFTPDLTSWTIQISGEGVIQQAVRWHRQGPREEELLDSVILGSPQLVTLSRLLERSTPDAFRSLERAACIDDAAIVSLVVPHNHVKIDLPYFDLAHDLKKGRCNFNEEEQASFALFGQLWKLVDQAAPYSLAKHQKGRTRLPPNA